MEAGQALVSGLKSPELVAGYILLSLYPVPSHTWEEDRGWLMLGVAIRYVQMVLFVNMGGRDQIFAH